MSQHRIRGWFGMLAIAALAVAFLFPGVALAAVGGTVTGTVVDGAAAPIDGIMVVPVLPQEGGSWREEWGLAVPTGPGGAFTLTLPTGEYRIRFVDPTGLVTAVPGEKYYGYEYYPDANWADAGTSVLIELESAIDIGEQVLLEGATISGTVTADAGGAPLIGIHAVADVQFGGGWPGVLEGITDSNGEYTIVGLPPGTFQIHFWDENHIYASERYNNQYTYRLDLAEQFALDGPGTSASGIDASLAAACSISGTITGDATPLNGARVWLAAWNDSGQYWMWVEQTMSSNDGSGDGHYTFAGLGAGTYRLMAEGPDGSWATECYSDKPPITYAADDITVGGADPVDATVDVDLAPAGYIEGWVLGDGEPTVPLEGSPVNVCINQGGWFEDVSWASTDVNGYFKAGGLAEGIPYYVQFMGGGGWIGEIYDDQRDWSMATPVPVTAGLTTTLADAVLDRGASIEGHVYGPDGTTPLGNIGVTPVRIVSDGMGNEWFEFRDDRTVWTDGTAPVDGHFLIEGLEPGEWAVRVYDPTGVHAAQFQDGALIPSATSFTMIGAGESWAPLEITMRLGGSISGTVYDDGDPATPLEGINVAAWIPFGGGYEWIVSATTGSDGTYQIDGLAPGEVFIEFQGTTEWLGEYYSTDPAGGTKDRGEADPVLVTAGLVAGPFDANLDAAASVSGYVTTGGGVTPLGAIAVIPMQLETDGENTWWNHRWDMQDETDGAGFFEIGGLTPGTWSLMYTDPNGMYATEYWHEQSLESQADMFDITGGGPQAGSYDADLEMGCTITGHVSGMTESDPVDLANIGVSANVDRGDWYESVAWTSTDPLGDYTLTGMGAGTYLVEFYGDVDWLGQFYSEAHPYTRDWMEATPLTLVAGETLTGINALLQPASRITGHVTTFDGVDTGDAEGINVMALTYNDWDQRWEFRWDLQSMTDANGLYTIGGLDGGDYRVFFQDPEGYWASEFYHDAVSPLDGTTVGVTSGNWVADEQLVQGNTITGQVIGFIEEQGVPGPLEGIMVAAGPYSEDGYYEHIAWANTLANGMFELRGLPAGSFKVQIWDDAGTYLGEFYNDTTDWSLATPVVFGGEGGSEDLGTIELGIAASVIGHVSNGTDDLAGIGVRPMYWRDDGEGGGWWEERWDLSRQTNEDGTFTLTGLPPSVVADTVIVFEDPSGMYAKEYFDGATTPGAATMLALAPGPNDLGEVVLELGNHITGMVTSDGTTGLGGITVAAGPYDPDTGQYEHIAWATTSIEEGLEGTYDLGGLPPGSYVVQFWDDSGTYVDQYYSITEPGTRDIQLATPVDFAGSGETHSGIDAQMMLGATVSGTVTEPDGISGIGEIDVVPLFWQSDGGGGGWWDAQWHRSVRTGPDGGFTLGVFEPGETLRLLFQDSSGAWAYEYYDNALTADSAADVGPLAAGDNPVGVIMLDPANHIQGTVDSADGPLGGMTVAAGIYDRESGYYEHVSWTMTSSEPGMEGTYDLGGLPPGSYIVQFWDDAGNYGMKFFDGTSQGTTDWEASLPVDFSGSGETVTGVDVYLDPAAYVSGAVSGDDGSGPVALGGIDVELYTYNGDWWDYAGWTQTGEDGTYRFGGLVDGSVCRVWFSDWTGTWAAEAYADASSWMWGDEVTASIDTPAEGIDVALSPAGSVTGVVAGGGVPLAGAPVSAGAYNEATDQWDQYFYTETDMDGTYTLMGLKPGVAYLVQAGDYFGTYTWTMWTADGTGTGDWHTGDDVFVLPPPEEPTVCDFDLSTGGYITGHVENALGESLAGVDVMLFVPTEVGWDDWWGSFQGVQGSTDENGDYRVGGLYPGDYRILFVPAEGSGYANEYYNDQPALSLGTTITVSALGEEAPVEDAVLSLAAAIEGHVYDDGDPGVPLEDMEVRVAVATGGENEWRDLADRSVMTDATGYYRIEGLRPEDELYVFAADFMGSYLEEWWQEAVGFAEATPVSAPQSGIDFTLAQGGHITGTITLDPPGTYENIGVTIYRPVGEDVDWHLEPVDWIYGGWGGIDEAGNFSSGPLPSGQYAVAYYDDSGVYASEYYDDVLVPSGAMMVNVVAGGSQVANATLTEAAHVSGFVTDTEANPVPGIEIRAFTWDESLSRWEPAGTQFGTSDETGAYFLPAPTGVTFIVEFMDPGDMYALQYFDGVDRSDLAQTFSMLPGEESSDVSAVMMIPDVEAPTTAIQVTGGTLGQNGWYTAPPSITLTPDEPATTWYQWGSDEPLEYTDSFQPPVGENVLTYWSADSSENTETPKPTQTFKLDETAPSVPGAFTAARSGPSSVLLTWSASGDAESGLASYTYTQTGPQSGSGLIGAATTSYTINALPDGTYTFNLRARNTAGLLSAPTATLTVVIDTTAPVTTASTAPGEPDGTNGWFKTVPTITLGSTATDLDWIVYRWGEGVTTTYTAGFEPPAQGTSTLWWHGADEYGNVEAWKSQAFKLDSDAPAAPGGVGGMALGQTTASFWWSAVAGDTSGVARYRVYRDGSVADEVLGTSFDAAGLAPGTTYVFTVRAIDNAGNEGPLSEPVSVTTDAPTLHTVTFRDWDGTVLKSEEVPEGSAATAPAQPTRADYTFAGWDVDFSVITSDLTVTAMYTYNGVVWETVGDVDYARVAGALRFDTAAQSALDAFPAGAATAVIAYGRDFPDALAASPLAGAVNGPILLTETATLPQVTADALTDLGVTKVYIVGGTGVVSPAVEAAIQALGVSEIERLFGANRYITARKIADEAVALGASTTEAFLVRGDDFADALAVSSIAAQEKVPVLLTTTATLHTEARGFFTTTGTDDVYIAGGTGVVSAAVQAEVDALAGVAVERWYGDNRYLTGAAVVRNAMTAWAIPMVDIGLASGENFPDALAGGAVMGYKHGLLLLTQPTVLSAPTATLITENKATIESVEFFGGTGALAPVIPTTVQQLLQ